MQQSTVQSITRCRSIRLSARVSDETRFRRSAERFSRAFPLVRRVFLLRRVFSVKYYYYYYYYYSRCYGVGVHTTTRRAFRRLVAMRLRITPVLDIGILNTSARYQYTHAYYQYAYARYQYAQVLKTSCSSSARYASPGRVASGSPVSQIQAHCLPMRE